MGSKAKQQRAEKGMIEKEPGPGLLDPGRGRELVVVVVQQQQQQCHYSHKLAGPPIISWPKSAGFSGDRSLEFGHSKDNLAASSLFQVKRGRGCCVALRGTYI
jgi:hypothetical protein